MRFDLKQDALFKARAVMGEFFDFENDPPEFDYDKLTQRIADAIAAESALLAPSPCPNGCRMCDWVERTEMVEWDGPPVVNENTGFFYCRHCAELERVRTEGANWVLDSIRATVEGYPNMGGDIKVMQSIERHIKRVRKLESAAALEQAAALCDKWAKDVWDVSVEQSLAVSQRAEAIRKLIPADAQGGPKDSRAGLYKQVPTSCSCGGNMAWVRITNSGAEEMVGCVCHTFADIESRVSERTKELREALREALFVIHTMSHQAGRTPLTFDECGNPRCVSGRQLLARGGTEPRP